MGELYRIAVDRVKASMGRTKLQALSARDVERFYQGLGDAASDGRPLSAKTIRNFHVVLRKALSDAERLGLIQRNPAAIARPPVPERKEQRTWSSDDLRDFFAQVSDDRHASSGGGWASSTGTSMTAAILESEARYGATWPCTSPVPRGGRGRSG